MNTRTTALLHVPADLFEYVRLEMIKGGYDHALTYEPTQMMLDMHGVSLAVSRTGDGPLDPAGQPKISAGLLERRMADVLNKAKSWADDEDRGEFPVELRTQIDAILMAFEQRRYL
jgi:hypothetical protein